jgi:hypothetical protein
MEGSKKQGAGIPFMANGPKLTEDQEILADAGRAGAAMVAGELREARHARGEFTPAEIEAKRLAEQKAQAEAAKADLAAARYTQNSVRNSAVGLRDEEADSRVTSKAYFSQKDKAGNVTGLRGGDAAIKVLGAEDGADAAVAESLSLRPGASRGEILQQTREYLSRTNVFDSTMADEFLADGGKLLASAKALVAKQNDGDVDDFTKPIFDSLEQAAKQYANAPTIAAAPTVTNAPTPG